MEISEAAPAVAVADVNKIEENLDENAFVFKYLPEQKFPNFQKNDIKELFMKWGLIDEHMFLARYRFNQRFQPLQAEEFLRDLFASKVIQSTFPPLNYVSGRGTVKFEHLVCQQMNMGFFDPIFEEGLCNKEGNIRGEMEEVVEGMNLGDKLRQALGWEESEHYSLF